MKRFLLAAAFVPLLVFAQAPGPSPAASPSAAPAAAASPAPATTPAGNAHDAAAGVPLPGQAAGPPLEKNIPLIPETAPSQAGATGHSGRNRPGSTPHPSTLQAEQDIKTRILLREAATHALNDPAIHADWVAAQSATQTDPRHRELLAVFYNHLYDRMIKINPTLADRVNARREAAIDRMKYTRLGEDDSTITAEELFAKPSDLPVGPNPPTPDQYPASGQ